jgi:hypothetical protein
MKGKTKYSAIILILYFLLTGCIQKNNFPLLKGPYLGQKPPGMTPELFAPGIISTERVELNSVFSPDGNEFFFAATEGNLDIIYYTERIEDLWMKPKAAPFSGNAIDVDMSFSPDGNRLYFCSNRKSSSSIGGMDIWYSERTKWGWSEAVNIGASVNSSAHDTYPICTQNQGMYFESEREGTKRDKDVYYTRFFNGEYLEPQRLNDSINSDFGEGDTYVAFDESFMIINSWGRPDEFGKGDLYISFKKEDGSWTKAKNMGAVINTEFTEYCPFLSYDGKYLFFTSTRTGNGDIYWVDAQIIDELKPDSLK